MTYKIIADTENRKKGVSYELDGVTYTMGGVLENNVLRRQTENEAKAKAESTKAWNEKNVSRKLAELRSIRNNLLKETDFYALSDVTMSSDMATYRQNLRDLTNGLDTAEKIDGVTWPTKP